MAHEFIARNGLISLQSSSFVETIFVSGSIKSPTVAEITSSWALSASFVQSDGYVFSFSTASQIVDSVNTFKRIEFGSVTEISNWESPTVDQFICSQTATYEITLESRVEKSNGGAGVFASKILIDGQEVSGSYRGETVVSNNAGISVTNTVISRISSGSILTSEFATSTANIRILPMPLIGISTSNTSAKIKIRKA